MLWTIALAAFAAAVSTFALAYANEFITDPLLDAALLDWTLLPYVVAGSIAWWRRPDSRFGPLMIVAGFGSWLTSLQWASSDLAFTIGIAVDLMPPVLFLHVFLAFPDGRLGLPARLLVAVGYFTAVGLQLAKMLLGLGAPHNLLAIWNEPSAGIKVEDVQIYAMATILIAGIPLLALRRRASGRHLRSWVEVLVYSFALVLVLLAVLLLNAKTSWITDPLTVRRIAFFGIGLSPIAFLIGLLSARLARSTVADLLVKLHTDPPPAELPALLGRTLRDPSVRLAYWLPEYDSWADLDGQLVTLPEPNSGEAATVIERDGVRLAALVHSRSLEDEPELLDAVSAAAGIALENGRLQSELRARLEELRGSRERVIEAGQKERQRLERNLHDGAQQRLISLSLDLSMLEARLGNDPEARAQLDQARDEIAQSLEELREVAHGLHPAVVSGHGLTVALESLAARAPVPVRLNVDLEERVDEQVEVAAYYVVSESLANIGKHAEASSATIEVARANGELVVEIVDDGVGGADSEAGSGVRGLADRVEALGGRLRIWSPRGGGTRVRAELPCE
jgi:signal transduction histidine kinase